jgi:hypothetical protein
VTSVVWDPDAPPGANFSHPATLQRADGRPFDFFCCGHAPLSDGAHPRRGRKPGLQPRQQPGQRDAASFDPAAGQWSTRPPTAHGRRLTEPPAGSEDSAVSSSRRSERNRGHRRTGVLVALVYDCEDQVPCSSRRQDFPSASGTGMRSASHGLARRGGTRSVWNVSTWSSCPAAV